MRRGGKEFVGWGRTLVTLATSVTPLAIIGVLLYAALFVKAGAVVSDVRPPVIERRDTYLGVALPGDKVIWAAGGNGKVVRSDDDGTSWRVQATPTDVNLQSIAAWSADQALAVGNAGVVIRTEDGGKTWQKVDAPRSDIANKLMRVRVLEGGVAWAVGEVGAVLKSTDFGRTWSRVLEEKDRAWNDVVFVGENGWMVGEFGEIARSIDGGATWAPVSSGVSSSLMAVRFRDAEHGVAVGLSGRVVATADGGATWNALPPQTKEHLNAVAWDGARWVAVGDKGVMVVGNAAADTWTARRISEGDLGWRTQIEHAGADRRYVLAGSSLGILDGDTLRIAGRSTN
jgi:photosystem II stability/assembly factor-like uncharacterized protein